MTVYSLVSAVPPISQKRYRTNSVTTTDKREVQLTGAECFQFGESPEATDTELRQLYAAVHVDRLARTIFPFVLDVFDRVRICSTIADTMHSHTASSRLRLFTQTLHSCINVILTKYEL